MQGVNWHQRLESLRGQDIVVLGLPRGGVPVAFEVAKALRAPLDVLVVRKLGVPFQPELAFGAIGEGGEVRVINDAVVQEARLNRDDIDAVESEQRAELQRRSDRVRGGRGRNVGSGRSAAWGRVTTSCSSSTTASSTAASTTASRAAQNDRPAWKSPAGSKGLPMRTR